MTAKDIVKTRDQARESLQRLDMPSRVGGACVFVCDDGNLRITGADCSAIFFKSEDAVILWKILRDLYPEQQDEQGSQGAAARSVPLPMVRGREIPSRLG